MKRLFILVLLMTTQVFAGLDAKGGKVINVATPTDLTDAANKEYVDDTTVAERYWFNVKDYGATGDGTTDDSIAIQATIDAVDSGGGVVYLPPGTYNTGTTTINGKALIEMIFDAGAEIAYTGSGIALDFYHANRGTMREFTIRRPRITASNGTCIRISGFHKCSIIEPFLLGKIGIVLRNGNTARIIGGGSIQKDGTAREAGSIGIDLADPDGDINDIIIDVAHIGYFEKGILLGPADFSQRATGITITADFEFNKDAIYIYTGTFIYVNSCWFEQQTRASIYIENEGTLSPHILVLNGNRFGESGSVYNIFSTNYHDSIYFVTPVAGSGIFSYGANTKVHINSTVWMYRFLVDEATPSVLHGRLFRTAGTTTITDFADGIEGQEIIILAGHSKTITDGTNIFLNGSVNFDMKDTDTLTLIYKPDNNWYELSRKMDSGKVIIGSDPPATATSTGTVGTITYDSDYFYVAVATDTWKRTALSTWAVVTENVIFAGENVIFAGEQVVYP